jgi:C4-dicarboxylate-specific signal transduction histidine kinase
VIAAGQQVAGDKDQTALAFAAYLCLVVVIAVADYVTGYDIRLATLYLFPIGLATWRLGAGAGTFMAVAATFSWLVSFQSTHPYSSHFYFYWEGAAKVVSFLFVVWLLARLRSALAHSDERFVKVIEGLAAAVFVEDARSGQVLFANPRFRQKFGEQRPRVLPEGAGGSYAGEVQDAESHRWYLVRSQPLRWIDGRAVNLRLISDITEEKRVQDLMERHRDAAHRSARLVALGEFASAIAHEINQPLAAIATYNESCLRLLGSGRGESPELRAAMEKCREQARRAGTIIQRLRELLRHPLPALAEQDLNQIARAALELAQADAGEAGVRIELASAPRALPVRADRVLIEQVVLNLVRNAIDATQEAGPGARNVLVATTGGPDHAASLLVMDWGKGVPPAVAPRVFEAFVTTKPQGIGLGLSICRSVIEAHGGSIGYMPNTEGGSVFEFTLPGRRA